VTRVKVLVLGLNYPPEHTGIAPYTAGMARGLSRDHDVQVVTAHPHYLNLEDFRRLRRLATGRMG